MTVPEKLAALCRRMEEEGVDVYLIPTGDDHSSEYAGDYYNCRAWLTGFTGSAGTAAVACTPQGMEAGLWTDGRYFIQAARQLEGTGITLYRMGEPGVPTLAQWLETHLSRGGVLGYDGRVLPSAEVKRLSQALDGVILHRELDLVGDIWADRPARSCRKAWELDEAHAGRSRTDKLAQIRAEMAEQEADCLVLPALDDIAWLLNLRGDDVACNPVVLAFAAVEPERVLLFAQPAAFDETLQKRLAADGVELAPYEEIYDYVKALPEGTALWMDAAQAGDALWNSVPADVLLLDEESPVRLHKACKNPTELEEERRAHVKDGAALCRFLYWLKHRVGKEPITECSAAEKLEQLRKEQPGYLGPSFETIAAYGAHGAIVHYAPTPETDIPLEPKGLFLVDSGGQYLAATTDVTRTIALGPVTDREREMFTLVLRSHLALGAVQFREGCRGDGLDVVARGPLWERGLDFNHGTGHGVGCLLNVHEDPVRIRWRAMDGMPPFMEGMVVSNEPGFYEEGAFGIRTENLMACRKTVQNQYGTFLNFETLTLAPIDLDAVDPVGLDEREKERLNQYHARVYREIAPLLPPEEAAWLKTATRPI